MWGRPHCSLLALCSPPTRVHMQTHQTSGASWGGNRELHRRNANIDLNIKHALSYKFFIHPKFLLANFLQTPASCYVFILLLASLPSPMFSLIPDFRFISPLIIV